MSGPIYYFSEGTNVYKHIIHLLHFHSFVEKGFQAIGDWEMLPKLGFDKRIFFAGPLA